MTDSQITFAFLFALVTLVAALVASARRPLPIVLLMTAVAIGGCAAGLALARSGGSPSPPDETLSSSPDKADTPGTQSLMIEVPLPRLSEAALDEALVAVDQFASTTGTPASTANELVVRPGDGVTVAGWAFDVRDRTPCRALLAIVDGRHAYRLRYGFARADVATAYHDPARTATGYQGTFGIGLQHGVHGVRLACLESGDHAGLAPGRYAVVVR